MLLCWQSYFCMFFHRREGNEKMTDITILKVDEITENQQNLEIVKIESEKENHDMRAETQKLKDQM